MATEAVASGYEYLYQNSFFEQQVSLVIPVGETIFDQESILKAEQLIRYAGMIGLNSGIESHNNAKESYTNLTEAIKAAAEGDDQALELVKSNVATDVLERTIKSGLITEVNLYVDEQDNYELWQHGQKSDDIQINTLVHVSQSDKIRQRSEAETRNSFRIKELNKRGILEDYYFVVFSRAPDDMSKEERENVGFFESMPVSIQVTSSNKEVITTESAFVSGKNNNAERHDEQTLNILATKLGLDFSEMTPTQLIDSPVLIHKSLMNNGVIDLVKIYDDSAGGKFFGEDKPRKDYIAYKQECLDRAEDYMPKIQSIVGQLLSSSDSLNTPIDGVRLLNKLSNKEMLDMAIHDKRIVPAVFGGISAVHIEEARMHYTNGNIEQVEIAINKALKTSKSSSCPSLGYDLSKDGSSDRFGEIEDNFDQDSTWHGGKIYQNSKCNCCKKVKKEVGACKICKDCVSDPYKMKQAFERDKLDKIFGSNDNSDKSKDIKKVILKTAA